MNAANIPPVDIPAAEELLMKFLSIEGVTGKEKAIGQAVSAALQKAGVPASAIRFDTANERIPVPTEIGNLMVDLPGTRPGPRLMFATHLDTVLLCAGAKPRREGNRIVSDGTTALGGDARTGVAVLVAMVETLLKHKLPHPPLTLVFTVREESGLHGARELIPSDLKGATMCFNLDGGPATEATIGAAGQEAFEVEIKGLAAHSGLAPEKGISSTMVAAVALTEVKRGGWFGRVEKPEGAGTSNVGIFGGKSEGSSAGNATNVVTDYVLLKGEARSHDPAIASAITAAYKAAFAQAAAEVKAADGSMAEVKFDDQVAFPPFRASEDDPVVQRAMQAIKSLGLKPTTRISGGGQDANWFVKHGVPTVTIGSGQNEIHTVKEWVNLEEFANSCRLAVTLATMEG